MSDTAHEPEGIDELATVAAELKGSVDALGKSFAVLSGRTDANRRIIYAIGSLAILKVVTIVVLIVIIINMGHTNHRLEATVRQNIATEQEQTAIRVKTLCPLYELFLGAAKNPAVPPAQRATAAQIKVIQDGYNALKCK